MSCPWPRLPTQRLRRELAEAALVGVRKTAEVQEAVRQGDAGHGARVRIGGEELIVGSREPTVADEFHDAHAELRTESPKQRPPVNTCNGGDFSEG